MNLYIHANKDKETITAKQNFNIQTNKNSKYKVEQRNDFKNTFQTQLRYL
jgi:hypothetical protein